MKIPAKIVKFLDSKKIKYEIVEHKTVYTAYDKAATLKIKPNVIGKTLVLKASGGLVMVLVPGNKNLDLAKITRLREAEACFGEAKARLRSKGASARQGKISFVSEKVLKNKFKGVKLGAIPPFGELWLGSPEHGGGGKLPLFLDKELMRQRFIFVSSGIYEASFKLSPRVFEKLGAVLGNFSKAKSHR